MTRPIPLRNVLRGFLLLSLSPLVLPAQTSNANYRPGVTDPAGNSRNLTLFRDEQIYSLGVPSLIGSPPAFPFRAATLSFDGDLKPASSVAPLPWSSDVPPLQQINAQTAAGRIVHPDKDDVVVVQRSATDSTKLAVRFSDGSGETLVGNMQPRSTGYADFFATSVGDLDQLHDSKGNYHDEVVVAWMEQGGIYNAPHCLSLGAVPHIAVLNYNGGVNPSVLTQTVIRDDNQYLPYCYLDIYNQQENLGRPTVPSWAPMPADNIMATAIGDFDGDGHNELAVAYMRGTSGLVISVVIYRYQQTFQTDGTTVPSLTPVNNYEFSIPNSSMVATLSLAAGNFDGSGVDQLLIGTAGWWGKISNGEYQTGTFVSQPFAFLLTGGQTQAAAGQTPGSITGASANTKDSAKTDLDVNLGSGAYVPQTVTIAGATGTWAPINGTWDVTPITTSSGGPGFTLDIDSSGFGSLQGNITVSTAAPLTQTDFTSFEPIPGTTQGGIEVDDKDVDAYIRVQVVPGLFHYDPGHQYDTRRRQIAMAWNSRAAVRYTDLTQDGDTHLAILQIIPPDNTPGDKIQVAATQNLLIGNWQLFQTLSMAAGALRGNNDENDPTWSLYFSGVGSEFDHNQPSGSRNVYKGMVAGVWKVSPVSGDSTKLNPEFVCSDKATSDSYSPPSIGAPLPVCPIWVDSETAFPLPPPTSRPGGNLNYLRLTSVAADLNGNSLKLGAPLHMQLTNPGKADFILEQPPQHTAWLDTGTGPGVVSVSRFLGLNTFSTSLATSDSVSYASKTTNHTDWTAGVSEKLSAQASWAVGANAGPLAKWSEQNTVQFSARLSYDYDHVHNDYTSGYTSLTTGQGATTGEDDSLIVESQILDLWRYRVYGQGTETGDPNNSNAFYDIVIPGPSLLSNPAGATVEWYQPQHEIGNILSYPGYDGACGSDGQSPSDIGPITIPNTSISNQAVPLIKCQQLYFNGNSASLSLQFNNQSGSGTSTNYTNKVSTGLDFQYTYRVDFDLFGSGGQFQVSSDTDVHGGQNWGQATSSDSSATGATGITLNAPKGNNARAYPYYPIFYNTSAGGLKVAYGVGDITINNAAAGTFWTDNYAQLPDPALNLPNRFTSASGSWQPDTTIKRKSMKGFVVRRSTVDPITGNYPLLGRNAQDGDSVLLEARVYNYSISATPANFTVQFSVIPYDSRVNSEICANIPTTGKGGRVCPASARTVIGTGTTQPEGGPNNFSLSGRDNTYAYLLWDTTGFGPSTAGASQYRVYVDLVSSGSELYPPEKPCTAVPCEDNFSNETIVDPGQNNEGWGLVAVAKRALGGPLGGLKSVNATHGSLDTGDANGGGGPRRAVASAEMSADGRRRKKPKPLVAFLFQPLSLRLTAFGREHSNLHGHVSIYDGKPGSRTTKTIAIRTLRGVSPDGTSFWFTWTPKNKGLHHLYAVIHNTTGVTALGDLVVKVRRAPGDMNEDGRVDRHDLNMLNRDLNKSVAASACGEECDLDGDGRITQKDADLIAQLCDSESCAFPSAEYVGGPSSAEPDMRALRTEENAATAAFLTAHPEDKEVVSSSDQATETQLYRTELQRKQSLRSIQYWYKGKPVTSGPYAQARTGRLAEARSTGVPIQ
jgi:hypothetical protein